MSLLHSEAVAGLYRGLKVFLCAQSTWLGLGPLQNILAQQYVSSMLAACGAKKPWGDGAVEAGYMQCAGSTAHEVLLSESRALTCTTCCSVRESDGLCSARLFKISQEDPRSVQCNTILFTPGLNQQTTDPRLGFHTRSAAPPRDSPLLELRGAQNGFLPQVS